MFMREERLLTGNNPHTKRPIEPLLLGVLAVLLFLSAFQKQRWDSDIFWALKSGEWIFKNLSIPRTDPFSYTFYGSEWIDFTWGFQVLAHLFYTYLWGWWGVFLLQLAVTLLTFFFIHRNLRLLTKDRGWLTICLLYLAFAISYGRFFIRPHLFSYLFISIYLFILNSREKTPGSWHIFLLLPLQVLWVNIHSSFILGIFIIAAYALSDLIPWAAGKGLQSGSSREVKVLLSLSFLLPAVSFINPYGWKLAVFPFVHTTGENAEALKHIAEWSGLGVKDLLLHLYPIPIDFFAFKVVFFAAGALLIANLKTSGAKVLIKGLLLWAVPFYMAVTHARFIILYAFFAVPVLSELSGDYLSGGGKRERGLRLAATLLSVFIATILVWDFSFAKKIDDFGAGIKKGVYPEGTVSFIKNEGVKGNIYNEYVFGGYLIYNGIKVFIDGRTPTVYSPYFFWTTLVSDAGGRWDRLVGEHGINMMLLKITDDNCQKFWDDKGWIPVIFDDVSVLYLKKLEAFERIISKRGLKDLNPCAKDPKYELPGDSVKLKAIREELKAVVSYFSDAGLGDRISRPHRLLGLADTGLGKDYLNEAESELKKAVEIDPSPYTFYDLGLVMGKLKRSDDALAAFKRAGGGFDKGYLGAGLVYYDMKDYKTSITYLEKYVAASGVKSEAVAYGRLGLACFKSGAIDCAVRNLKKAAFTTDDAKELAEIYYNLGNSLLERGDYKEAAFFYSRLLEKEPQYVDVLKSLLEDFKRRGRPDEAGAIAGALGKRI
ncbi:MAG: tetratricopeptide repeat protein [Deltaproteobacteria bacterium]|nr:tetratricopeptide repeat protein [Deltaproteobacteria bacterium]